MASCVEVSSENYLVVSTASIPECSSYVVMTSDEYQLNSFQFDATEISGVFLLSFGLVLLSYKTAWLVGVVKNVLNQL